MDTTTKSKVFRASDSDDSIDRSFKKNDSNISNGSQRRGDSSINNNLSLAGSDETECRNGCRNTILGYKIEKDNIVLDTSLTCQFCNKITLSNPNDNLSKSERFNSQHNLNNSQENNVDTVSLQCISQLCSVGSQIILTPAQELTPGKWLCSITNAEYKATYMKLTSEFFEACEKDHLNNSITKKSQTLMGVQLKNFKWYRAVSISKYLWALVDDARVVKSSEIVSVIPCPKIYSDIPSFACVLILNPTSNRKIELGSHLECNVEMVYENISAISWTKTNESKEKISFITNWQPQKNESLSSTSSVNLDSTQDQSDSNISTSLKINSKDVTSIKKSGNNSKSLVKMDLKNGVEVLLVSYVNSSNVHVRLSDSASRRKYDDMLNSIAIRGKKASAMSKVPNTNDIVLCKDTDNNYYRGIVKSHEIINDTYDVAYLDLGKVVSISLSDMKEYEFNEDELKLHVAKISLAGIDTRPPNTATTNFVNNLIKKEAPLICKFDGKDHRSSEVVLTWKDSGKSLNKRIESLMIKPLDRIIRDKIVVADYEVIMGADIPNISLSGTKVPNDEYVKLLITDVSLLTKVKAISCTKADPKICQEFQNLTAEINDYCIRQPKCYVPKPGETCLALFEDDDNWYRGMVLAINDDEATVYFFDYGNFATVQLSFIKKLIPDFATVPQMACLCYLSGIPEECSEKVWERLKEILERKSNVSQFVQAKIVKHIDDEYTILIPDAIDQLRSERLID